MKKAHAQARLDKRRIARLAGHDIVTVSAFAVRDLTKSDEEFTNFAIQRNFPDLIPAGEIWIDERLFEREGLFYLANALTQLHEQESGTAEETAYAAGLNVERMLRERLVGVKYRAGRPHKRVPRRIYDRNYVTLPDPVRPTEVWLVDGNLVRSFYKTDYTEGGHGYVYAWVPKAEIWAEYDLDRAELPYVVAHEYVELRLMRDQGLGYDRAHEIAAQVEYELREGGDARPFLVTDRRKPKARDLSKLTTPEFFEFVLKRHVQKK